MRTLQLQLLFLLLLMVAQSRGQTVRRGCKEGCGGVSINYPFGIGENCFLPGFQVSCKDNVPTLAAAEPSNLTLLQIQFPDRVRLRATGTLAVDCQSTANEGGMERRNVTVELLNPFRIPARGNGFKAVGCNATANISNGRSIVGGCQAREEVGECEVELPDGSDRFFYNVTENRFNCCSYAALVEDSFDFNSALLDSHRSLPLIGEWEMNIDECKEEQSPICGLGAICKNSSRGSGYHCYCKNGAEGNPYLNGTAGCSIDVHFPTVAVALGGGFALAVILVVSLHWYGSWAQKALMRAGSRILRQLDEMKLVQLDDMELVEGASEDNPKDYERDELSTRNELPWNPNRPSPISAWELPSIKFKDWCRSLLLKIKLFHKGKRKKDIKASVFKAKLPVHGLVEVRKYDVENRRELEPFMRAVATLSQGESHPNIVRLVGVNVREHLLVYKHFSDQTLFDRLHRNCNSNIEDKLSWDERLAIARGTASGLAHAHARRIYHRDMKSSNILLDGSCNPGLINFEVARLWWRKGLLKVSKGYVDPEFMSGVKKKDDEVCNHGIIDFGLIKLCSKIKKTLMVCIGSEDPDYMAGGRQLSAKSDVYSFGVVLVELLTGRDPSLAEQQQDEEGSSLAMQFVTAVNEGRLDEVVYNRIWDEEQDEDLKEELRREMKELAKIAMECLEPEGEKRPTMQYVCEFLRPENPPLIEVEINVLELGQNRVVWSDEPSLKIKHKKVPKIKPRFTTREHLRRVSTMEPHSIDIDAVHDADDGYIVEQDQDDSTIPNVGHVVKYQSNF